MNKSIEHRCSITKNLLNSNGTGLQQVPVANPQKAHATPVSDPFFDPSLAVATRSGQVAATNGAMVFNSEINLAPELPLYSGFNNELLIECVAHPFFATTGAIVDGCYRRNVEFSIGKRCKA